jgi:hypothetical protein
VSNEEQEPRIIVDEDWKSRVAEEKRKAAEEQEKKAREVEAGHAAGGGTADDVVGQAAAGAASPDAEPPGASTPNDSAPDQSQSPQSKSPKSQARHAPQLPPATFDSLVETLSMQAMASLNEAMQTAATEKPESGSSSGVEGSSSSPSGIPDPRFHLSMAKYLIDTLSLLEEKTKGNLTSAEEQHLEKVLHDLRMGFVAVSRQVG